MNKKFEKLSLFFDHIQTVGLWQRIFGWRLIKKMSYDAYGEFKEFSGNIENISQELDEIKVSNASI